MLLGEPSARPESQSRSVASEAPFALGCLAKAVNLGLTGKVICLICCFRDLGNFAEAVNPGRTTQGRILQVGGGCFGLNQ